MTPEASGQLFAALLRAVHDSYLRDPVTPEVAAVITRAGQYLVTVTRIRERWAGDRERVVGVPAPTYEESLLAAAEWVCGNCGAASVAALRREVRAARAQEKVD